MVKLHKMASSKRSCIVPRHFVSYGDETVPSIKVESTHSAADTDVSDSSQSVATKGYRRKNSNASIRSNRQRKNSEHYIKGRLLARESGFDLCKTELCLVLLPHHKRRYLWQRDRIDVAATEGDKNLTHYAGGTRIHVIGDGSFTVRNCHGMLAVKCLGDRKQSVILGTRPVFPGNKATCREGATNFYPWFQVRLLENDTASVSLCQTGQPLWYSAQMVQSESTL